VSIQIGIVARGKSGSRQLTMDHIFIILPGRLVTRPAKSWRTQGKCRGERLIAAVGGKAVR